VIGGGVSKELLAKVNDWIPKENIVHCDFKENIDDQN